VTGLIDGVFRIDVITRLLRQEVLRSHEFEGTSGSENAERTVRL